MTRVLRRPRSRRCCGPSSRPSPGEPAAVFRDDALLSDVGVDSLALIEALLSVRDQILEDLGLSVDDVGDPPTLPWIETVGELIAYVRSSLPAAAPRSDRRAEPDRPRHAPVVCVTVRVVDFQEDHQYDAAPDVVFAMLSDPDFLQRGSSRAERSSTRSSSASRRPRAAIAS